MSKNTLLHVYMRDQTLAEVWLYHFKERKFEIRMHDKNQTLLGTGKHIQLSSMEF